MSSKTRELLSKSTINWDQSSKKNKKREERNFFLNKMKAIRQVVDNNEV